MLVNTNILETQTLCEKTDIEKFLSRRFFPPYAKTADSESAVFNATQNVIDYETYTHPLFLTVRKSLKKGKNTNFVKNRKTIHIISKKYKENLFILEKCISFGKF